MKKIYSVRWEDGDGGQGYYVKMTKAEAAKVERFLIAAMADDTIKAVDVSPIEGNWLLTPRMFTAMFKERYSS